MKKSKILFIYPPSKTQYHQSFPMGLLYLTSVLETAGYIVDLLDANASNNKMNSSQIVKYVETNKPDLIGMTLLTPMIKEAYRLAGELKKMNVPLLAGGPHSTLVPKEPLYHGFDAAVIGEGENVIEIAVEALLGLRPKEKVPGWMYLDTKGNICFTEPREFIKNLDDLPLPSRHRVVPEWYGMSHTGLLHSNLFSSRGCPAHCSFCSGHLFGKKFRFRSAKSMLDEIQHLYETYGTSEFHFVDDAMTLHRKRLIDFCEGLKHRNMQIKWTVMTRIDAVNEKFLEILANAGCKQINYGVESGHPETLKRINKPHTVQMVKDVIPMTAKMGIRPAVFFILGFPWEDIAALDNTLQLMQGIAPYVSSFHPAVASILIPFPGTEIYETYKDEYCFENWWLSEDQSYDQLVNHRGSYFESKVFRLGNILKANFFNYSNEVKAKIIEIFRYMHFHNLSQKRTGFIQKKLLLLSESLHSISPLLENVVFKPVKMAENILKNG